MEEDKQKDIFVKVKVGDPNNAYIDDSNNCIIFNINDDFSNYEQSKYRIDYNSYDTYTESKEFNN